MSAQGSFHDGVTRRTLIVRTGEAAGAVGLASIAGLGPLTDALAAGGSLTQARQQTYRAMLEAVALVPDGGVSGALDAATRRFARWYGTAPDEANADVDLLLDEIDSGRPGGFANASPRARLQ